MADSQDRAKFFRDLGRMVVNLSDEGYNFMPFSFYRTKAEQEVLVSQGKSKTMDSKHCEWLACDLVFLQNGGLVWTRVKAYEIAGKMWEDMGHTWGGRWESLNDIYHFEF